MGGHGLGELIQIPLPRQGRYALCTLGRTEKVTDVKITRTKNTMTDLKLVWLQYRDMGLETAHVAHKVRNTANVHYL